MTRDRAAILTDDNRTSGHGAIITGAAKGIGRATALALSHHNVPILAVDRDASSLAQLVAEINDEGGIAHAHVADVSDSSDVRSFVDRASSLFNGVEYFFNNAGIIGRLSPLVDYPEAVFDQVIAVNLRGVFLGLKYVLPGMYERRSGAVVNSASVAGLVGHVDHAGYVATNMASLVSPRSPAPRRQNTGCVSTRLRLPVRSEMMDAVEAMKSPEDADVERQRLLQNIPAHRYGTVADVAAVVLFLLIGESNYLNGTTVTVDGAFTAVR